MCNTSPSAPGPPYASSSEVRGSMEETNNSAPAQTRLASSSPTSVHEEYITTSSTSQELPWILWAG